MAENTKIEWAHHTFNPWIGCTRVGPGCDHCYAARQDTFRRWTPEGWGGPRRRTSATNWKDPIKWNAEAERLGTRYRVFCSSLADVFDNQVPPEWRYDLFNLILSTPHLDWLLLTKRIGNAAKMIEETLPGNVKSLPADHPLAWPWPHVWIGATIVNQEEANRDIPKLLATPAAKRFLSMEPLLGPVDLKNISLAGHPMDIMLPLAGLTWTVTTTGTRNTATHPKIDWVIVGGESGTGARPMHPEWALGLRDQCRAAGVPFLFKQWGEWAPGEIAGPDHGRIQAATWWDGDWRIEHVGNPQPDDHIDDEPDLFRIGKAKAGRLLDGALWNEVP